MTLREARTETVIGNTTRRASRSIRFASLLVAITALLLMGAETRADDEEVPQGLTRFGSMVEFGLRYNDEDSYKFGNFTGWNEQGVSVVGELDIGQRAPYDATVAQYWRLRGANLGEKSRSAEFEFGHQGLFDVGLFYRRIPVYYTESAETIFGTDGSNNLKLRDGWIGGTTPGGIKHLVPSLREINLKWDRQRMGGEFSVIPMEGLELSGRFQRETKEGNRINAGLIAASGGNPRAALLPEPIDWATNQVDANLSYAVGNAQLQFGYHMSDFDNKDDFLTWENPYLNIGGWNGAVGFDQPGLQLGQKALAPDNKFHQFTFSGGYNLPANTRATLSVALGRMTQDESFLPYTINPALDVMMPLPRSSLDGRIDTTLLDFRVVSRPLPKLTLLGHYRYDDRDNETPRALYVYVPSDAADQGDIESAQARVNIPYSYTKQNYGAEVRYRLPYRSQVMLEYERETIERTYSAVGETQENRFEGRLRSNPWDCFSWGVDASHGDRDGDPYRYNETFLQGFSLAHLHEERIGLPAGGNIGDLFENHPDLRQFYLTDRKQDEVRVFSTITPIDTASLTLSWTHLRERFGEGGDYNGVFGDLRGLRIGLRKRRMSSFSAEANYAPTEWASAYAFYTFEKFKSVQDGWTWSPGAATLALDTMRDWTAKDRDTVHTIGGGGQLRFFDDKLELGADYLYSRSQNHVDVATGMALGLSSRLPNSVATLHNVRVNASYNINENMAVKAGYVFEKLKSNDWAIDNIPAGALGQVITLQEESPEYRAHVFWLSFVYKFWL